MFNFIKHRRLYFLISAVVIVPGIIAMLYSIVTIGAPVRLGIDFVGGSLFEIQFQEPVSEDAIREVFADFDLTDVVLQELQAVGSSVSGVRWQVRTVFVQPELTEQITAAMSERIAPLDDQATVVNQVSPTIGAEVTQAAVIAVVVATFVILGFIVFSFRQVP
ncbi:MAG: hypothetical protein JXN59_04450, partial [Anaerolineae bacterium]|nr:hypothetical protein [Anaerolineae bacterium]